jgi:ABC-2 type transport system ATP-binding protein
MWEWCATLRATGVTIILTTHYIEEAEEMADRIGVINKGEIILVEDKAELMQKLGKKQLTLHLQGKLDARSRRARRLPLELSRRRQRTDYTYDTKASAPASPACSATRDAGIRFKDLDHARARWKTSSSAW